MAVSLAARLKARTRALPLVVTSTLLLGTLLGGPAAAADDPEAAIEALFEAVSSRELDDLEGIACSAQQEALREGFSDGALGLDLMVESFGNVSVSVDELRVEMIEAGEEQAQARVTGSLVIDVDEDQVRDFVRELIEAGANLDDPPVTDADIDAARPLMADVFGLEQAIDETITLVTEDGGWVVCSGFGTELSDSADDEASPMVSDEGLCALVTPAELSELSSLNYDSSTGFGEFCTYSQSDWDQYHAATLGLIFDSTLDEWREIYTPDGDLRVGAAAAFSSGADVFTQAGTDVLQVTVSLPRDAPPEGVDVMTQAAAISELFLPRLDRLVAAEIEPEPTPAGPSLCDALSLQELNHTAGRAFDSAEGDLGFCTWTSSDPEAGLDMVAATVTDLTLDEFRQILDVVDEGEVDGTMAIKTSNQAVVELPDGRTLDVSVYYDESVEPTLPADVLALTMAERLAPEVTPGTDTEPAAGGLLAGRDNVDDICRALPFEELSAISGVAFEDPIFGGDFCEYYGGDDATDWHYAAASLDHLPLSTWLEDHPDMTTLEIGGQPAAVATNPFDDGEGSALAVVAVPGFDDLTFSAYLVIGTGSETDPAATVTAVVELGLMKLIGSAD